MNTVNHYNVAEKTHKHTCMQAHINISAPVWCRQTSVSSVVANSTYYKCYKNEKKKKSEDVQNTVSSWTSLHYHLINLIMTAD